jgi:putative transcriptional regulator
MSNFKAIRERLGATQVEIAEALGCTQGNIAHYENGQRVPPDAAARLIRFARKRGHKLSFDEIYADITPRKVKTR